MENNRIPKNLYNGSGTNTESRKAQQTAGTADRKPETLKKIEAEMDKRAADIALTVSDMFKFMAMTAAILPNMELDTGLFRLKVDDDGIFFEINIRSASASSEISPMTVVPRSRTATMRMMRRD